MEPTLTPLQCRAARALLGWSQAELAANARVAVPTVAYFELGERTPIVNTLRALQTTLERGGVMFARDGHHGVAFRHGRRS